MNIPKVLLCALTLLAVLGGPALPGEKEVLAFFQEQGARITLNKTGQATKLSLNAKTGVLVQQFQSLGELKHLEELAALFVGIYASKNWMQSASVRFHCHSVWWFSVSGRQIHSNMPLTNHSGGVSILL